MRVTFGLDLPYPKTIVDVVSLDAHELPELKTIKAHPVNRHFRDTVTYALWCGSNMRTAPHWYGGLSDLGQVESLLRDGWPEGAERVRELASQIRSNLPVCRSVRRKPVWAGDGDEVCKDRLNAGLVDECWRVTRRELANGPQLVTIEANWGGPTSKTADELFWLGAAAAALSDVFEDAGYRVEIVTTNLAYHKRAGRFNATRVRVKEPEAPMRLDQVAAVMCHAGVFRTLGLLAKNQVSFKIDRGHGHTEEVSRGDLATIAGTSIEDSGVVLLPRIYSQEDAVRALEAVIESMNKGE